LLRREHYGVVAALVTEATLDLEIGVLGLSRAA
jgi:hypothetical protein